ncbi:MAG: energy-coupling factor transporter ATPase, partial [Anaerotignum sp.]|nr:energy-coupling factor transporter ATPase [Anaerotignum sp.]
LVSHSMEDVAKLVDRIIVMHRGQVAMTGTPREIFSHPLELEQMGLAAPQVSYVFAQLKAKGYDVPTDVYTVEEAKEALLRLVKQVNA